MLQQVLVNQSCPNRPLNSDCLIITINRWTSISNLLFAGVVKRIPLDGPYVVLLISFQQPCSRRIERIIRVRIIKKAAYGKKYLGNSKHWRPLFLEDIQTDDAILGYVRVEDLRLERYFGGLKRIVRREAYIQVENTRFIRRILRSQDARSPHRYIIPHRPSRAIHRRIFLEFLEFLLNAFLCHFTSVVFSLVDRVYNLPF